MKKRILSMLAVLAMVLSIMPQAFADETTTTPEETIIPGVAFTNSTLFDSTNYYEKKMAETFTNTASLSHKFNGSNSITEMVTSENNDSNYVIYKVDFTNNQGNLSDEKIVVANLRAKAEGQIKVSTIKYNVVGDVFWEDLHLATIDVKPRTADIGKTDYTGIIPIAVGAELGNYWNGMTGERYIKFEFISETADFCRPISFRFAPHNTYSNQMWMDKAVAWVGTNKTSVTSGQIGGFSSEAYYVSIPVYFYGVNTTKLDVKMNIATGAAYHNTLVQLRLDHPDGEVIAEYMYDTQNKHSAGWDVYKEAIVPVSRYISEGTHLVYITLKTNGYDQTDAPYAAANNPATNFKYIQFAKNTDTFAVDTIKQSHHYINSTVGFADKDYMNTKVRFDSSSTTAEKVMLVAALYDANNKLVSVNTNIQDVVEGLNTVEVETKWQDAKNAGAGNYTWKAFIWDGTTLSPVAGTAKELGTVTIAEEVVEEE